MEETYFITPTGGRPTAIALLARYLDAQRLSGGATWMVVDDCDPPTRIPTVRFPVEVVRPSWRWKPGMNTQASSMAAGLDRIPDNAQVIVLEDDDAYLPGHAETMLEALTRCDLVGEAPARYFNVATGRSRVLPSSSHASLAATAVKGGALRLLRNVCTAGSRRIDLDLWHRFKGSKQLLNSGNVVGIKGLPGRSGIGVGHRADFGTAANQDVLVDWLGHKRAALYDDFRRAA